MLADVAPFLRCPACAAGVEVAGAALACRSGHRFDVARQGYVNLLVAGAPRNVETGPMVAARARFLAGGHFAPLAGLLAERAAAVLADAGPGCVLDVGAGPGYYLARVLERAPARAGVALDLSRHAARRAARAHARIGAVVADASRTLPVADGAAAVVLSVFAPRNAGELHRVLDPRGALLVAAPTPRHLAGLVEALGLLRVDEAKDERLAARLEPRFELDERRELELAPRLTAADLIDLVEMGPSAWHVDRAALERRLRALGGEPVVRASFEVRTYRPRAARPAR